MISDHSPGDVVVLSLAERMEIDLPEPRQDHGVLKLTCLSDRWCGKMPSARVFQRERSSPAFGHDWTQNLTGFPGFRSPSVFQSNAMTTW